MKPEEYIQEAEEKIVPLTEQFLTWAQNPDIYYQLAIAAGAITIAYVFTFLIKAGVKELQKPKRSHRKTSLRWLLYSLSRIIFPAISIFSLIFATQLAEEIVQQTETIDAIQRLSIVWLLWACINAFVSNTLIRTIGLWMVLPAALLQLFGWFEPVTNLLESYGFTLGKVEITAYTFVKAIFFVSIIIWLGKLISNAGEEYIRRNRSLTRATKELLIKLFDVVLYAVLFMTTLNLIGIDLTALAVFSGALGVGLGFGLQKVASNFISGIILLSERSININNLIEMDDGVFGYVRKLGARASVVETFDGKEVMVPNEDFITSRVANLTHTTTKGRVGITVGVSYGTDLRLAYDLIKTVADDYESAVHDDEELSPQVYLRDFGSSSVDFLLTFWLEDVSKGRWRAKSDVMFAIWDAFKENDIEIPFPQRDLHLRSGFDQLEVKQPSNLSDDATSEDKESA
ncbi:mechanosensitive ion channel family protein [Sneathiella glossodoripedis]|uniref:mechanosensitive ion channel family protein n=1 Tax=Sneathiella glossodoripedis TaxID=418853 RepID=UPI000471E77E|nr:mechanosensitive ion channel domain-containing protein [Sneathiella glossodoripedis]